MRSTAVPTTAARTSEANERGRAVTAARASPAQHGAVFGGFPAPQPDSLWRSLFYFNVYRVAGALVLLVIATTWGTALPFGARDETLFVALSGCYALLSLGWFLLIRIRWRFDFQLTLQVAADVLVI